MQQMWSPWRSQYIQSFKDETEKPACFLCAARDAVDADEEHLVVHRAESCFVILNRYPYNSGHVMVVPQRHSGALEELTADELAEIMLTIRDTDQVLRTVFSPHGMNIGANLGRTAGAGLPDHLHFHLVPRWNGDTNFMPVLSDVKVVSESLEDSRQKISDAYEALRQA